ncbi:MAG: hypothetical protein FWH54_06305 [Methanobrevibacter sp.]|nr:hypothetical protein [Methanobrevibacter sp.]
MVKTIDKFYEFYSEKLHTKTVKNTIDEEITNQRTGRFKLFTFNFEILILNPVWKLWVIKVDNNLKICDFISNIF